MKTPLVDLLDGAVESGVMNRRRPVIEVTGYAMVAVMRAKKGAERLRIASRMYSGAFKALTRHLRSRHPDWTQQQIHRETARRMSHGTV
jgi:hypothetical protein